MSEPHVDSSVKRSIDTWTGIKCMFAGSFTVIIGCMLTISYAEVISWKYSKKLKPSGKDIFLLALGVLFLTITLCLFIAALRLFSTFDMIDYWGNVATLFGLVTVGGMIGWAISLPILNSEIKK